MLSGEVPSSLPEVLSTPESIINMRQLFFLLNHAFVFIKSNHVLLHIQQSEWHLMQRLFAGYRRLSTYSNHMV